MPDPRLDTKLDPIAEPHVLDPCQPLNAVLRSYDALGLEAYANLEQALTIVAGDRFHKMAKAERTTFIAKLRELLLKSNWRLVCPECGEPSLPYFLQHTKQGTVQLQHKHATPPAHVVYGTRDQKITFPILTLVQVETSDAEK
ncbi:MAG: hypothetical protein K2X82_17860 [Gemmataceae bacterium]|nr:hypothetical protein [Gemmataceae bacterium]